MSKQAHGTNNLRLTAGCFFLDQAQPIFIAQRQHELYQIRIANAAAQLPVEHIDGSSSQWIAIDLFNRPMQLWMSNKVPQICSA